MDNRIYIIDDEPDMIKAAALLLKQEGYLVSSSTDPIQGLAEIRTCAPDLILLDNRMPKMSGPEVCKELKSDPKTKDIPIIIVSAKSSETDVVVGLEVGAEDYIRKPYFARELISRVKLVLQRKNPPLSPTTKVGPFTLDASRYTALADGKPLPLTAKEFELFSFFLQREGRVLTRSVISQGVWGMEDPRTSRTIDFHVYQLRKKLGHYGVMITGLKGVGYRFDVEK